MPALSGSERLDSAVNPPLESLPARPRPRCGRCGDVIGVYEPMVLESPDGDRETSVAAEPHLAVTDRTCFHRDCYAIAAGLEIG